MNSTKSKNQKKQKVIEVQNLVKDFRVKKSSGRIFKDLFFPDFEQVRAVDEISFSLSKGESVAFLGPNGAGKTTTTKMLTGLIYPTDGKVSVLGYFPFDRDRDFLKRIGLVMGNKAGLNWDLTPNQSFDLLRQIYHIPQKEYEKTLALLTDVLDTKEFLDVQVRKLSLGERMKMELIGAILHNPEILFLDEPTIGLDIISKRNIREFLRTIQKEFNTTLLLTSHDMDDIESVCDRVLILTEGKIVYDGDITVLTERYKKLRYVKFIFGRMPEETEVLEVTDAKIFDKGDKFYSFRIENKKMPQLISEINSNFELDDIDIVPIPLEEIIANIFKGKVAEIE
jgi:ABC-2 type transport system ATP-binding protein